MNDQPPESVTVPSPDQPQKKKCTPYTVKIVMGKNGAAVTSKDGALNLGIANGTIAVRFHKGETEGYFKVEVDEYGVLEIGDRTTPKEPW